MPHRKPKPSEVAIEAKRMWIPYIDKQFPTCPARSFLYRNPAKCSVQKPTDRSERLRVAVIDGNPVDVALSWFQHESMGMSDEAKMKSRIPIVNMANENRAGGDWESGLMAPEECLARRSNLVRALTTPWRKDDQAHHPIPATGGLYSPTVMIFRDGPCQYKLWNDFVPLPVISVAPVRRPKLNASGTRYSFDQEKDLMLSKMRAILRIAIHWSHKELCLGAFGVGSTFRNPAREVARMWKDLLFHEAEFQGAFTNIVFAIERHQTSHLPDADSVFETFEQEFQPSNIFGNALIQ